MGGGHQTDKDRFLAVFKINLVVFIAELFVGYYSGSLSMISDGLHVALHLFVSLVALVSEYEFLGFRSDNIKFWSAGINIFLFFPLAFLIAYEASKRWVSPPMVNLGPTFFIVGFLGLAANVYAALVLKPKRDEKHFRNKNRPILYVHMIFDAIGSVIVIAGGIEIKRTGLYSLDPQLSFVLAGLIILGALWMSWELISGHDH